MTVWEKVEDENCYAVAIYNYTPPPSARGPQLPLEVGQLVRVTGRAGRWRCGRGVRGGGAGAFPAAYVVERPCYQDVYEEETRASCGGDGIVHEIATALRRWIQQWKLLYVRGDTRFKFVEVSMRTLLELRAQCASRRTPHDQLRRLSRAAAATLDKAARSLNEALVVRAADGAPVRTRRLALCRLHALFEEASAKLDNNMEPRVEPPPGPLAVSVVVRLAGAVPASLRQHELRARLQRGAAPLTELADPAAARFTELSPDIRKEKVHLVVFIVKTGPFEPPTADNKRGSGEQLAPPTGSSPAGASSAAGASGAAGLEVRQPLGVAAGDVSRALSGRLPPGEHLLLPFYPYEKENLEQLARRVVSAPSAKPTKHGLWVSVDISDSDDPRSSLPPARALAAAARGARNELHVTLVSAASTRARNLQCSVRLHAPAPLCTVKQGAICTGAGAPLRDEYTSLVYYHEDRPRWDETFKVVLDTSAFRAAHLVFTLRHRSGREPRPRPAAVAALPLMAAGGTTVPDGVHDLPVYKIETKKSANWQETEAAAAAAAVAAGAAGAAGRLTLLPRDQLVVRTQLASAKLTQREEIVGVLACGGDSTADARDALTKLQRAPPGELLKFHHDLLDALAHLLTQDEEPPRADGPPRVADLALDGIARVASAAAERQHADYAPLLQEYLGSSFCNAQLYLKLLPTLELCIEQALSLSPPCLARLLPCMKSVGWLLRLASRSHSLHVALRPPDVAAVVRHAQALFERVLVSLSRLMSCGGAALTCQGAALRYLPHAAPALCGLLPAPRLAHLMVKIFSMLRGSRLAAQRLGALRELAAGPLGGGAGGAGGGGGGAGGGAGARATLLPHIALDVAALLRANHQCAGAGDERSVHKVARLLGADSRALHHYRRERHMKELCVELLGQVTELVFREQAEEAADEEEPRADTAAELSQEAESERGWLLAHTAPELIQLAASLLPEHDFDPAQADPLLRRCVCVLLDMAAGTTPRVARVAAAALSARDCGGGGGGGGGARWAAGATHAALTLLRRPVLPAHWHALRAAQHRALLHLLRVTRGALADAQPADSPDSQADSQADSQVDSQADTQADSQADSQAEDVATWVRACCELGAGAAGPERRAAARELTQLFADLSDAARRTAGAMTLGSLLEFSLVPDAAVRGDVIPLLHQLLEADDQDEASPASLSWQLYLHVDGALRGGAGDAAWRGLWRGGEGGGPVVARVADLVPQLIEYRAACAGGGGGGGGDYRLLLLVQLLDFYRDIGHTQLYVKYVHEVCALHCAAGAWTEAAMALRLHEQLLPWPGAAGAAEAAGGELPPAPHLPRDVRRAAERGQLKMALVLQQARWLAPGAPAASARAAQRLLARLPARAHAARARLHARLARLHRALAAPALQPVFYWVVMHNPPPRLRVVEHGWVVVGAACEALSEFSARLQDEWGAAALAQSLPPRAQDLPADRMCIQIVPLRARGAGATGGGAGAAGGAEDEGEGCCVFTYDRPEHRHDPDLPEEDASEFATRWLERAELRTEVPLPNVTRWAAVSSCRRAWLSPLDAARAALGAAQTELAALVRAARAGAVPPMLTMRLAGMLDPAVQGGVAHYSRAFLAPRAAPRHPAAARAELRRMLARTAPLAEAGIAAAARGGGPLAPLVAHLASCARAYRRDWALPDAEQAELDAAVEAELRPDDDELWRRDDDDEAGAWGAEGAEAAGVEGAAGADEADEWRGVALRRGGDDSASKSKFFSFNGNPLSRYSGGGGGYFSTLQATPRRRDKRRARKSEVPTSASSGGAAQWYTREKEASADSGTDSAPRDPEGAAGTAGAAAAGAAGAVVDAVNRASVALRELTQELVCERPPRVSVLSSNRDSIGTTDSNPDEEPPPLPAKSASPAHPPPHPPAPPLAQGAAGADLLQRHSYDMVSGPRGSFLYRSLANDR